MKKKLSILCCMILFASLAFGCGNKQEQQPSSSEESSVEQSEPSSSAKESSQSKEAKESKAAQSSAATESFSKASSSNNTNNTNNTSSNTNQTVTAPKPSNQSPEWASRLGDSKHVTQFVAVCGTNGTNANVSMHQKNSNGYWEQIFNTSGYIGRDGLGQNSEYTSNTPIGTFALDTAFGIGSNPGCSLGYTKLTNDLYWSGDHRSGYGYNQLVSINNIPDLNVSNSEHLLEVAPDYYYAMNIGCNPSNTIGKGFAFFIHCYGPDPYTEGCVAIPRDCMKSLLTNVRPGCVIIIDYESNLCS